MLLYYNGKLLRYLRYYGSVMYEVHSFTINLDALHFIHYNTKIQKRGVTFCIVAANCGVICSIMAQSCTKYTPSP